MAHVTKALLFAALLSLSTLSVRAAELDTEQLEDNEEAQQIRDEPAADVVSQVVEQADDVDLQRCAEVFLVLAYNNMVIQYTSIASHNLMDSLFDYLRIQNVIFS